MEKLCNYYMCLSHTHGFIVFCRHYYSIVVHCAVVCTRSLFDMGQLSWVHCYRNMACDCVVVCEWSHLVDLDHQSQHTNVHKEKMDNQHSQNLFLLIECWTVVGMLWTFLPCSPSLPGRKLAAPQVLEKAENGESVFHALMDYVCLDERMHEYLYIYVLYSI